MKKLMFVLAALLLCGAAFADDPFSSKDTSKFVVGLMIMNPTDSLTKQSGSSWLGFDISYHLKFDSADRPTRSINLGYIGGDKDRDLTGIDAKASFMPIRRVMVSLRKRTPHSAALRTAAQSLRGNAAKNG